MLNTIKIGDLFKINRHGEEHVYMVLDYNPHVQEHAYLGLERVDDNQPDCFRCAGHYLQSVGKPVTLEELQVIQKRKGTQILKPIELARRIELLDEQVKRRNKETEALKRQRAEEKAKKASEGDYNNYKPY